MSLAGVAAACSDDAGSVEGDGTADSSDTPSVLTSEDPSGEPDELCAGVITDDVVADLAWVDPGTAVRSAGRCERGGKGDLVTVGADPTVRPDGGSAEVQQAYADACQSLSGDRVPEQDPDWLGGASACVVGLDGDATAGFVELYTISDGGWLVHGQVAQSTEVANDDFRKAVAALVANAAAADWA